MRSERIANWELYAGASWHWLSVKYQDALTNYFATSEDVGVSLDDPSDSDAAPWLEGLESSNTIVCTACPPAGVLAVLFSRLADLSKAEVGITTYSSPGRSGGALACDRSQL